jgi:DNA-binding MarR family transcriptional regulator
MTSAPVAGELFQRARAAALADPLEQQLLELIAGFADAGWTSPPARTLAALLAIDVPTLDRLLDHLERRGVLRVEWAGRARRDPGHRGRYGRRNRYQLLLDAPAA